MTFLSACDARPEVDPVSMMLRAKRRFYFFG
jgi:hypothetical protein